MAVAGKPLCDECQTRGGRDELKRCGCRERERRDRQTRRRKRQEDLQRGAQRKNGSPSTRCEMAEESVTRLAKRCLRDPDHLKFVGAQPCLACGRSPSDAHHLKFAQGRALERKVSDEFTVPLCRTHHRELHRYGDERIWWQHLNVNPIFTASALWVQTHPDLAAGEVSDGVMAGPQQKESTSTARWGTARFYETKPIIAADTP